MQELANSGRIKIRKIPGADNIADAGTTVLSADRIKELAEALGIYLWEDVDPAVFYALLFRGPW